MRLDPADAPRISDYERGRDDERREIVTHLLLWATRTETDDHKRTLCELIDVLDADTVENDWTGEQMSKDDAKKYVMEYGK